MAANWLQMAARCKFLLLRSLMVANGCNQKWLLYALNLKISILLLFESACKSLLERNKQPFSATVANGYKWLLAIQLAVICKGEDMSKNE